MKVRVAYLRRDADGDVVSDGVQLAESFDIDYVPRIGEHVVVPKQFQDTLQLGHAAPFKRFEVVGVEHRWDKIVAPVLHIYLSTIKGSPTLQPPDSDRKHANP